MLKFVFVLILLGALNTCLGNEGSQDDWRRRGFYRPRRNYPSIDLTLNPVQTYSQNIQNKNQSQNTTDMQTRTYSYDQYSVKTRKDDFKQGHQGQMNEDSIKQNTSGTNIGHNQFPIQNTFEVSFGQNRQNQKSGRESTFGVNLGQNQNFGKSTFGANFDLKQRSSGARFGQNYQNFRTIATNYNDNSPRKDAFSSFQFKSQTQDSEKRNVYGSSFVQNQRKTGTESSRGKHIFENLDPNSGSQTVLKRGDPDYQKPQFQSPHKLHESQSHSSDFESKNLNSFETKSSQNVDSRKIVGIRGQSYQNANERSYDQRSQNQYFGGYRQNFRSRNSSRTSSSFGENTFESRDVTSQNLNVFNSGSNDGSAKTQNSRKSAQQLLLNTDFVPPYSGPAYIPPADTSYIASTDRPLYTSTTRGPFSTFKLITIPFYQSTTTVRPSSTLSTHKRTFETVTTTRSPLPTQSAPRRTSYSTNSITVPFYTSTGTTWRPFATTNLPIYRQTTQRPFAMQSIAATTVSMYYYNKPQNSALATFASTVHKEDDARDIEQSLIKEDTIATTTKRKFNISYLPIIAGDLRVEPIEFEVDEDPYTIETALKSYQVKHEDPISMAMKVPYEYEDYSELNQDLVDNNSATLSTLMKDVDIADRNGGTNGSNDGPPAMAIKASHEPEEGMEDISELNRNSGVAQSTTTSNGKFTTNIGTTEPTTTAGPRDNTTKTVLKQFPVRQDVPVSMAMKVPLEYEDYFELNQDLVDNNSATLSTLMKDVDTADRNGGTNGNNDGPPAMAIKAPHESEEELEDISELNRNSGVAQSTITSDGRFTTNIGTESTTTAVLRDVAVTNGPPAMAMKVPHESEEELEDDFGFNRYFDTTESAVTTSRQNDTANRNTTSGGPPAMAMKVPQELEENLDNVAESNTDFGTTQSTITTSKSSLKRNNTVNSGPPSMAMRVPHESEEEEDLFTANRDSGTTQSSSTTQRIDTIISVRNTSEATSNSASQSTATNLTLTSIQINTRRGPPAMAMKVPDQSEEDVSESNGDSGASQSAANVTVIQINTRIGDSSSVDSNRDIISSTQSNGDAVATTIKPSSINATSLTDSLLVDIIKSLLARRYESKVIVREPIVRRRPAFFLVLQVPPELEYDTDILFPFDSTISASRRDSAYLSRLLYRRRSRVGAYSRILGLEELDGIQRQVWHVGIYEKADATLEICGGTVIRADVVISDVNCFWIDGEGLQPAELFQVTASRIYRSWERRGSSVQTSDVAEIKIDTRFGDDSQEMAVLKLATPLRYTQALRPISVNFGEDFEKLLMQRHGSMGLQEDYKSSLDTEELLSHLDPHIRRRLLEEIVNKYSKSSTSRRSQWRGRSFFGGGKRRYYDYDDEYDY